MSIIDTETFPVLVDSVGYKDGKPTAYYGAIQKRLQKPEAARELTVEQLAEAVESGRSFLPALCEGGTSNENWKRARLFVLDVDNDPAHLARIGRTVLWPKDAIARCEEAGVPPVMYYFTWTTTPEQPRYRLAFLLADTVDDFDTAHKVIAGLSALVPERDGGSATPVHLYVAGGGVVETIERETLPTVEQVIAIALTEAEVEKPTASAKSSGGGFKLPEKVSEGERNSMMMRYGCSLAGKGVQEPRRNALMDEANAERFDPPLEQRELDAIKRSVTERYARKTRSEAHVEAVLRNEGARWSRVSDQHLSELFAKCFKPILRYVPEDKRFYAYNGAYWEDDGDGIRAHEFAKLFVSCMRNVADDIEDAKARGAKKEAIDKYLSHNKRCAVLADSKGLLTARKDEFDRDLSLLNVKNGTLDLSTMELRPHDPADMVTKLAPVEFDTEARCAKWDSFVESVFPGDLDTLLYARKFFGMCLAGDTSNELVHFAGYATRSGKGTMINSITAMLGVGYSGYACHVKPETLMARGRTGNAPSEDVAAMRGARLVATSEPSQGDRLDESFVKQVSGGDPITARRNYGGVFTFRPTFNVIVSANSAPRIADMSLFESGRVRVIPFDRHFDEGERDTSLKATFATPEAQSAILNWCLDGLVDYRASGLAPSAAIVARTGEYRDDSDKFGQFVDDVLEPLDGSRERARDVYGEFTEWCGEFGFKPESYGSFKERIRVRVVWHNQARVNGKSARGVIEGYRIRRDWRANS